MRYIEYRRTNDCRTEETRYGWARQQGPQNKQRRHSSGEEEGAIGAKEAKRKREEAVKDEERAIKEEEGTFEQKKKVRPSRKERYIQALEAGTIRGDKKW